MNPIVAYVLGLCTFPAVLAAIVFVREAGDRVGGWWRHRHVQVSYAIRCDRCGRTFMGQSKFSARGWLDDHDCTLREFMPSSELVPGVDGVEQNR